MHRTHLPVSAVIVFSIALVIGVLGAQALSASAGPGASQQQRGALADNIVTDEEYGDAVDAYLDCAEDAGYTVIGAEGAGKRERQRAIRLNDTDGVPDADTVMTAVETLAKCDAAHLSEISVARSSKQGVPSEADLDALYSFMAECLASPPAGALTPDVYATAKYDRADVRLVVSESELQEYGACALLAEAEFGFLAPRPTIREND